MTVILKAVQLTGPNFIFREHLLTPQPPLARAWLRRPIRRRCQCFVLWDVVFTVTPAPMACVQSATRNTCRDSREVDDPAPQERKVWGYGSVGPKLCMGANWKCEWLWHMREETSNKHRFLLFCLSSSSRYLTDSIGWCACGKHNLRTQRRGGWDTPGRANDQVCCFAGPLQKVLADFKRWNMWLVEWMWVFQYSNLFIQCIGYLIVWSSLLLAKWLYQFSLSSLGCLIKSEGWLQHHHFSMLIQIRDVITQTYNTRCSASSSYGFQGWYSFSWQMKRTWENCYVRCFFARILTSLFCQSQLSQSRCSADDSDEHLPGFRSCRLGAAGGWRGGRGERLQQLR